MLSLINNLSILGIPYLEHFSPEIDWITSATTIDGYTILFGRA